MHAEANQKLKDELISRYKKNKALFFIDDHLLVNEKQVFLLPLVETLIELEAIVISAILINTIIVLRIHTSLSSEQFLQRGLKIISVKPFLTPLDPDSQNIILKTYHWLQWDKRSKYCGKCSNILISSHETLEKKCSVCGELFFPRFSPAIIVGIKKDKELLLARSSHFQPNVYSAIAGFVEMGESAEMTVHREVREEVGIEVTNVTYVGSQSWPFPDSFMIAFKADYLRGEIKIDKNEIEDAKWFTKDNLPKLPEKSSIARTLLDILLLEDD